MQITYVHITQQGPEQLSVIEDTNTSAELKWDKTIAASCWSKSGRAQVGQISYLTLGFWSCRKPTVDLYGLMSSPFLQQVVRVPDSGSFPSEASQSLRAKRWSRLEALTCEIHIWQKWCPKGTLLPVRSFEQEAGVLRHLHGILLASSSNAA